MLTSDKVWNILLQETQMPHLFHWKNVRMGLLKARLNRSVYNKHNLF